MFLKKTNIFFKTRRSKLTDYAALIDKRDDYGFEIVNFPFLDGDVPRSTSYGVYISFNSFVLLEHLAMLLASTLAMNC